MSSSSKTDEDNKAYWRSIYLGQCVGAILSIGGFVLTIFLLAEKIDIFLGATQNGEFIAKLKNASPGILSLFVGLFILLRYKPRVQKKKVKFEKVTKDDREQQYIPIFCVNCMTSLGMPDRMAKSVVQYFSKDQTKCPICGNSAFILRKDILKSSPISRNNSRISHESEEGNLGAFIPMPIIPSFSGEKKNDRLDDLLKKRLR